MLEEIKQNIDDVAVNTTILDNIVAELVEKYSDELHQYMIKLRDALNDTSKPLTNDELDSVILKLPNILYFTGLGLELVGLKEDTLKILEKKEYNKVMLEYDGKAYEKQAKAEEVSQKQALTRVVVGRAYKIIQNRINAGYEQIAAIKLIIKRRMDEAGVERLGTK